MKVAEAIETVAARMDAVVAQPAGVAPGTDRVGMHAQDFRRTRDRQRRVERTRVQQVHLGQETGSPGRFVKLPREPTYPTFLAKGSKVPPAISGLRGSPGPGSLLLLPPPRAAGQADVAEAC